LDYHLLLTSYDIATWHSRILVFFDAWLVDGWMELKENKKEVVGEKHSGSNQLARDQASQLHA